MNRNVSLWLVVGLIVVESLSAGESKSKGANGFDGVYVGLSEQHQTFQNTRKISVPMKVVVFPDGKSILVNLEMLNVHSIPVRGRFDGNVFTGTVKKNLGLVQVRTPEEVRFTFSMDGKRVIASRPDGSEADHLFREGTPEAKAIRAKWAASLADIKQFDPSKHPFKGKSLDASTVDLKDLRTNGGGGRESVPIYGLFKVRDSMFGKTFLAPSDRNRSERLYLLKVASNTLPPSAVKDSHIVVPPKNPIRIFPGTMGAADFGEFYDTKGSQELRVILP